MRKRMLNSLYTRVLKGLPGLGTPSEAAQHSLETHSSPMEAATHLRSRYAVYSGLTGFVCGLPGYVTMPITIPSNIGGVLLLQLHMCSAMAVLGGHDPEDSEVKDRSLACLVDSGGDDDHSGESARFVFGRLGVKLGERGVRFAGEQAARWLRSSSRRLPLVGGVVGGYSDLHSTKTVADRAVKAHLAAEEAPAPNPA